MLYLDFSRNDDYRDYDIEQDVLAIKASELYSLEIEFKTIIDESYSSNEQRRASWSVPRRKWKLEFTKTAELGEKLENFFISTMGRYKAFKFKWCETDLEGKNLGGDGNWYYVRFDTDKLTSEIDYLGYRKIKLDLIEVKSGA